MIEVRDRAEVGDSRNEDRTPIETGLLRPFLDRLAGLHLLTELMPDIVTRAEVGDVVATVRGVNVVSHFAVPLWGGMPSRRAASAATGAI